MSSMIPADLLQILRCPLTGQPLVWADEATVRRGNATLQARAGRESRSETENASFTAALIREDRKVLYPVRDGIPVLLAEEAVNLS